MNNQLTSKNLDQLNQLDQVEQNSTSTRMSENHPNPPPLFPVPTPSIQPHIEGAQNQQTVQTQTAQPCQLNPTYYASPTPQQQLEQLTKPLRRHQRFLNRLKQNPILAVVFGVVVLIIAPLLMPILGGLIIL